MKNIIFVFIIQFLLHNERQCLLLFNSGENTKNIGFENDIKLKQERVKVGIVGAGISGLYTALILQDLGIDYELFEASNRIGGRIFTHYFNNDSSNLNYVDLGAMRLPNCTAYDRLLGNNYQKMKN
ncbi:hypothetical protein B4U80_14128 [Leptotrombidium deliense]|uniref:Amine oxidase domain-containing protein n=1 Tax=Leptotrombidium deliense TaxID=299467 RepID=A0A443S210_9ACAR|nr:hypothetical protein B4U80_14128 [Leptotrombidium deliense]